MTENEKNKEAVGSTEDWAIIPFDEAEDDARWSKLIEETDKLVEDVEAMKSAHGELLMNNKLSEIQIEINQRSEELF